MIFACQLEYSRYEGAIYKRVQCWFNAVASQIEKYKYKFSDIYNMDKSGFGVGEEQAIKVLIYLDSVKKEKVVLDKQEWVTDIECISAASESLTPLLIFKGEYINTRWISEQTPNGWFFAISQNGWISDDIGLQWLVKVFDPQTREKAVGCRRLLIADGHSSHIKADFIAYCMENDIDLMIMPPHCSHILQPLDVGVFSAFKLCYTYATHALSRLSSQRIPRAEWVELLVEARRKAVIEKNIKGGWRGAGLVPAILVRVLKGLPHEATLVSTKPCTPLDPTNLDLALLHSSPLELVALFYLNAKFSQALRSYPDIVSLVYRYADHMMGLCEILSTTVAL